MSQSSVRAHWASRTLHTNGVDVGLIDEDFDTNSGDPFSIAEGQGSRKRFRKSKSRKDVSNINYETGCPALRSAVHPGARPAIQPVVRPSSYNNVKSNRHGTTNITHIRMSRQSAVHKSVNKTLLVGCKSSRSNGRQRLRVAKSWTNFVEM